ncbi:carbon-nitrogen hydrolase family protein [Polymorphobacter sp. PAMC 29334]|nr:carbon-nitrogen hydrolase family protein [Polymorphobacter sp. PAMC 29334]
MLRIGVLQTRTGIDPAGNARALTDGIADLAKQGAEIVFTPEMSGLLDRDRARSAPLVRHEVDDIVLAAVCAAARDHQVWVELGSLALRPDRGGGRLVNRGFLIDPTGEIVARYDKLHLFDVDLANGDSYRESNSYAPGERAVVAPTPWGAMGLSVCYDVRFPALYTALAHAGAAIIAVPAAFTRPTGEAHWHVLLRARAIETGAFIVAAAQSGVHADGRETYGHSLVVDPWGTVLLDMGTEPGGAVVDLDLSLVTATRGRIPSLRNGRPFTIDALTTAGGLPSHSGDAPVAQPDRATVS